MQRISILKAARFRSLGHEIILKVHLQYATKGLRYSSTERRYGEAFVDDFKKAYAIPKLRSFDFTQYVADNLWQAEEIHTVGYLKNVNTLNKGLVFAQMTGPTGWGNTLQLITRQPELCQKLQEIAAYSPISVVGTCRLKNLPKKPNKSQEDLEMSCPSGFKPIHRLELELVNLTCLNSFPDGPLAGKGQNFPPESRHMQIRYDHQLRKRLIFRSAVSKAVREFLHDFQEIETPILFKSTPEGAKEFIVPSRKRGHAYALPQSPQQYKQILIASGIDKYYQFARCFRDEDLRADRQPEFTQIDLEMAFADGEQVMNLVESLIKHVYKKFAEQVPKLNPVENLSRMVPFPRITYNEAMSRYGSDKPDLRIDGSIIKIDKIVSEDLKKMLTDIPNPVIEVCKLRLNSSPRKIQEFVKKFMDSEDAKPFRSNPDGAPGFAIYDFTKPMSGLQIFGHEGCEKLEKSYSGQQRLSFQSEEKFIIDSNFMHGDLFLIQARKNLPFSAGFTMLGRLRAALYRSAINEEIIEPDSNHYYLWVTDFPLFTVDNEDSLGQGGTSGFHATHHPFTAPKSCQDIDLLFSKPLMATADHYDLVVNGIELGGGSRRIHMAEMQKYVMKDVLMMSDDRMNDFAHLFSALAAGCPPHAGMALGFDRLMAILSSCDSIKDVIAFPKSSKGDDLLVKSPSTISDSELRRYHLSLKNNQTTDS
ncbi:Aspartate--tRNA ligase, mitochondrial [Golovinomyces cichoracearum]|uniref:Aspartate--tRNA ligase, mitochondrial n=1 Tax=Golovinomyces cichoracearum TaxID=62708 RepID=A0A420JAB4_9PEZI|nr:Aspartate--tRNA ligase, mitochondrial [Golovinomyces cichoracearum]